MSYSRHFTVQRDSVNQDTGEFRAVLFTDGEASDGHILNIQGGRIPEQMPLFVNHYADPREQLGSLFLDRVTAHTVQVRGQIMIDGKGSEADIRRDILAKMAAGHVSRMSGRWDAEPEDVKRRVDLDKEHPAHVSDKARGRKRYGMYFDKWIAQEGSIVGLGADPQATMRWAEEAESEAVATFWRSLADVDPEDESGPRNDAEEAVCEGSDDAQTRESDPEPEETRATDTPETPSREARLAALAAQVRELVAEGVEIEEIATVIDPPAPEPTIEDLSRQVNALTEQVIALQGRVSGEPSPPLRPEDLVKAIREGLSSERDALLTAVQGFILKRQGRVSELQKLKQEAIEETNRAIQARYGHIPEIPEDKPEIDPSTAEELVSLLTRRFEAARQRSLEQKAGATD